MAFQWKLHLPLSRVIHCVCFIHELEDTCCSHHNCSRRILCSAFLFLCSSAGRQWQLPRIREKEEQIILSSFTFKSICYNLWWHCCSICPLQIFCRDTFDHHTFRYNDNFIHSRSCQTIRRGTFLPHTPTACDTYGSLPFVLNSF